MYRILPLGSVDKVCTQFAELTADFINRVGSDANGKVHTETCAYHKRDVNEGDKRPFSIAEKRKE